MEGARGHPHRNSCKPLILCLDQAILSLTHDRHFRVRESTTTASPCRHDNRRVQLGKNHPGGTTPPRSSIRNSTKKYHRPRSLSGWRQEQGPPWLLVLARNGSEESLASLRTLRYSDSPGTGLKRDPKRGIYLSPGFLLGGLGGRPKDLVEAVQVPVVLHAELIVCVHAVTGVGVGQLAKGGWLRFRWIDWTGTSRLFSSTGNGKGCWQRVAPGMQARNT